MSTTRATMKHAIIYSGAAIASRAIGLIMLPLYVHALRGTGYAIIGMLDVGMSLLVSLLAYGMQGAIVRLYHDEKDPARKGAVVSTGTILIGAASVALTLPLMVFSKPVASLLIDDAGLSRLVVMALITFNFELVGQAASSWLLLRSRSVLMSVLSLLRLFLGLSLNIWLILFRDMGLDGYFISSMAINFFSCALFVIIAFRDCGREFDPGVARYMGQKMLPLVPGALASWVGRQAERVLAKGLINLESVGILEMGYRFPVMIALIVSGPFMQSWDTRRFEIADDPGAPRTIARMFTYYLFIVTWVGLVMAVVIRPLLEFLTPPEFHLAYRIAQVEIVTTILAGAQFHLMFGLAYAKDTVLISKLRTGAAVGKVLLSWYFIARWGIYGAAFSAAVMGAVAIALDFHFSQKRYRLPLEWRALGLIAASAVGTFLWLNNWNVTTTPVYAWIDGRFLPWIGSGLESTYLGEWKDGKLVEALTTKSEPVTEILLKGILAAGYVTMLPVVHEPSRAKWLAFMRRNAK